MLSVSRKLGRGVLLVGVILLAAYPLRVAYVNARHAIERGHCQGFMKQVVMTCRFYSEENEGSWPSLSSTSLCGKG